MNIQIQNINSIQYEDEILRPDELQPLRIGQFLRFFMFGNDEHKFVPPAKRVDENTTQPDALVEVDRCHRHYHPIGAFPPRPLLRSAEFPTIIAKRRCDAKLCVPSSAFIEPLGPKRQDFYERKLLEYLPWFCVSEPRAYAGMPRKLGSFIVSLQMSTIFLSKCEDGCRFWKIRKLPLNNCV